MTILSYSTKADGYTHKEMAEILNIPLGTVKSRLKRGCEKMKNEVFHVS